MSQQKKKKKKKKKKKTRKGTLNSVPLYILRRTQAIPVIYVYSQAYH